ncbi:MAG: hypothetical protein SPF51_05010 [Candidatus Fimivicinus sp.]|nr:hypothetical protein [Candidatus Fimivicinus sp.]
MARIRSSAARISVSTISIIILSLEPAVRPILRVDEISPAKKTDKTAGYTHTGGG